MINGGRPGSSDGHWLVRARRARHHFVLVLALAMVGSFALASAQVNVRADDGDDPEAARIRQAALASGNRVIAVGVATDGENVPASLACATDIRTVTWPSDRPHPEVAYAPQIQQALERYGAYGIDYSVQLQNYTTAGDYLNYGAIQNYEADTTLKWSANGVPMVEYGGTYYENPITTMQYALTLYGRYVLGTGTADHFLQVVNHLVSQQRPDGGFGFPFEYENYLTHERVAPGWTSGMAQGLALSVFARAVLLTGNQTYAAAGDHAIAYLLTPATQGGPLTYMASVHPELSNHIWFSEYSWADPVWTLNGFGYTLIGLFDWGQVPDQYLPSGSKATTDMYFRCGIASMASSLQLFDAGGMSAYDLGHIVYGGAPNLQVYYHAFHISELHALNSAYPTAQLAQWEARWRAAVD